MNPLECEFEDDAVAAAIQGRWPDRVDGPFRAHIAACPICTDIVAAASAIGTAREAMRNEAVIPDAGRVWWLAQVRARREASEAAGRPITAAQVIAFACAAGLVGACFGATSTWFQSMLLWLEAQPFAPAAAAILTAHSLLAAGMAALVLVVPVAVYLAMGRD
jgi:hypothetical protein